MATSYFPDYMDRDNPHQEPVPGAAPWQDPNGVWHFGGDRQAGSGSGSGGSGSTPVGGSNPTTPTVPGAAPTGGNNIADLITQLGGGLLSGLGQIFGQQKRQSFSGTAADPVEALSGVQRRISDFAAPVQQRAESGLQRNTGAPTMQDYEHLKSTLRNMGITL